MSKFNSYIASDYAGMTAGDYTFYYGYEQLVEDDWAFVACHKGKEIYRKGISADSVKFDCGIGLLEGISHFLKNREIVNHDH